MYVPGIQVFKIVKDEYGWKALIQARQWENLTKHKTTSYEQLAFLHNCICNMPPKSLHRKSLVDSAGCAVVWQFQHRMMRAMINNHHRQIGAQTVNFQRHREYCWVMLTHEHFNALNFHIYLAMQRACQRKAKILQRKTNILRMLDNHKCQ